MRRVMNRILFLLTMITATVVHADDDYGIELSCDTTPELCQNADSFEPAAPTDMVDNHIKIWEKQVRDLENETNARGDTDNSAVRAQMYILDEVRKQNRILIEQNNMMIRLLANGANGVTQISRISSD